MWQQTDQPKYPELLYKRGNSCCCCWWSSVATTIELNRHRTLTTRRNRRRRRGWSKYSFLLQFFNYCNLPARTHTESITSTSGSRWGLGSDRVLFDISHRPSHSLHVPEWSGSSKINRISLVSIFKGVEGAEFVHQSRHCQPSISDNQSAISVPSSVLITYEIGGWEK